MKYEYNYVLLRYVHDIVSGEFVNVGVVLVAPKLRYFGAICTRRYKRISQFFTGLSGKNYREVASNIQSRIEQLAERASDSLDFGAFPKTADRLVREVLPWDDSSFQISPLMGGVSESNQMQDLIEELYERFVDKYERHQERRTRSDDDVWRSFRSALDKRHITAHFRSSLIRASHYEFEFKHSFRNGRLHVCQPISFDLAESHEIVEKAIQWYGRIQQLQDGGEQFKAYLLLGQPGYPDLRAAFQNAKEILSEVSVEKELIGEDQAEEFSQHLGGEIARHQ